MAVQHTAVHTSLNKQNVKVKDDGFHRKVDYVRIMISNKIVCSKYLTEDECKRAQISNAGFVHFAANSFVNMDQIIQIYS